MLRFIYFSGVKMFLTKKSIALALYDLVEEADEDGTLEKICEDQDIIKQLKQVSEDMISYGRSENQLLNELYRYVNDLKKNNSKTRTKRDNEVIKLGEKVKLYAIGYQSTSPYLS